MMSLLDEIKAAQLIARKAKDTVKSSVLTTLIGEVTTIGKNAGNRLPTDDEVIAVVRKFISNITDTLSKLSSDIPEQTKLNLMAEKAILEMLLPPQLSVEQITNEVHSIVATIPVDITPRHIGQVLKVLKDKYGSAIDMGVASAIVKKVIGG
jgi:uncharacterized protein YqeY